MLRILRIATTLKEAGKTWCTEDAPNWVFAIKTSVAGLLALWIAFRLDFAQPQWALMTVYIVARKESGLVMTKGFYRIVGTTIGCIVSLLLAAAFSQTAELFLLVLALWIGLCVGLAARYRNFQSYGFMLAGYTAAIVGFGAAAAPNHAFDIAQARVSEVVLGILCASVVAEAFFPIHASTRLIPDAQARFNRFTDFMIHAFSLDMDSQHMQEIQQGFLSDIVATETQRSAAFLESPDARERDARLRWMNASFMNISSTFHGFIQAMRRFRAQAAPEIIAMVTCHYRELAACLDVGHETETNNNKTQRNAQEMAHRLTQYRTRLAQQHADAVNHIAVIEDAVVRRDATAMLGIYMRVVDELSDYIHAVVALTAKQPAKPPAIPAFSLHVDSWIAVLSGLRAIGVLFVLSAFWIATAWPGGNGAAILGAVFCILFGSTAAPLAVAKRVGIGFVIGQTLAFFCLFHVLPLTDGFNTMALGMLPFLLFSAWLIEHPRYAVEGSGVFLAMLNALAPHNQMNYDIVSFINDGIATFIGLGAAGIAFAATPASPVRLRKRLLIMLGQQAAHACLSPLQDGALRHHFESRTRDLLYQLNTPPAAAHGNSGEAMEHAMAILEMGQTVIELRRSLHNITDLTQRKTLQQPMAQLMQSIAVLCEHRANTTRRPVVEALEHLHTALDTLPAATPAEAALHDAIQLGCYQIRAILRDDEWYRLIHRAANQFHPEIGVPHAA